MKHHCQQVVANMTRSSVVSIELELHESIINSMKSAERRLTENARIVKAAILIKVAYSAHLFFV